LLAWPSRQILHGSSAVNQGTSKPARLVLDERGGVRNRSRQRGRRKVDVVVLIDTVAQRAVAEPENTDEKQTWPSCFVEKGYQRVALSKRRPFPAEPGDFVAAAMERRPDGNLLLCHPRTLSGGRSRTSLPVRLSLAYRHFLAEDVYRRQVRGPSDTLRFSDRTQLRHRFDPLVAQKNDQSGAQDDRDVEPK
jgi:hypothetical protein